MIKIQALKELNKIINLQKIKKAKINQEVSQNLQKE
jgi:hypothetical protein